MVMNELKTKAPKMGQQDAKMGQVFLLINVHRLRQRSELSDSSTVILRKEKKKVFFEKFEIQIRGEIIFPETSRQVVQLLFNCCLSSRDFMPSHAEGKLFLFFS